MTADVLALGILMLPALWPGVMWIAERGSRAAVDFIFQRVSLQDEAMRVVAKYLRRNSDRSVGSISVDCINTYVRPLSRWHKVFYFTPHVFSALAFYRGAPIVLSSWSNNHIRFVRWTVDLAQLCKDAADYDWPAEEDRKRKAKPTRVHYESGGGGGFREYSTPQLSMGDTRYAATITAHQPPQPFDNSKPNIYDTDPVGWGAGDIGAPESPDMLGDLATSQAMEHVVADVKTFARRREWYEERGIPWRRGYLLWGKPGTGKSSLVRALAQYLGVDIHRFDLATFSNRDFNERWNSIRGTNRIVLLEDFDRVFDKQKNLVPNSQLTFDAILNALDGVDKDNGLILFVTANDKDKIDDALGAPDKDGRSTRPFRIDVDAEMSSSMEEAGRRKIASRVLAGDLLGMEDAVAAGGNDTPAQFTERCISMAVHRLWNGG